MSDLALVSGAGGWLGRRLLRALTAGLPDVPALSEPPGLRVRALARDAPEEAAIRRDFADVEVHRGDLRHPDEIAGFCDGAEGAILFHCAAVIHPAGRTREFTEVNVHGTRQLLTAAEAGGARRAVVVSSNSPVGVSRDPDAVFDERSPCRPYLGYGRSKLEVERIAAEVHARGALETVVVRAPWFYGPDQPLRQTRFFELIRKGRFPLVAGGRARRSLAYVDDLCQGLLLAARVPGAAGETYWIADRRPHAMAEIVATVARLLREELHLDVSPPRLRLPGFAADAAELADRALQVGTLPPGDPRAR